MSKDLSGDCQGFLCAQCHQLAVIVNRLSVQEIAWRLAQQCRSIVQTCLREEEWQDVDRESCDVIAQFTADWLISPIENGDGRTSL